MNEESGKETPKYAKYVYMVHKDKVSILSLNTIQGSSAYKVLMPNVGSISNARLVIRFLNQRDEEIQKKHEEKESQWKDALKAPHVYMKPTTHSDVCYCDKGEDHEIHVPGALRSENTPNILTPQTDI